VPLLEMVVDFPFEDVLLAANSAAETALVDVFLDVGFELWSLSAGAAYRTEDVVILYLHFTRKVYFVEQSTLTPS